MINIWIRRRIAWWHQQADELERIGARSLAAECRAHARKIAGAA